MRRKATLAITLAAAMAATAVPAMADDKVSITIFNSKMEIQSQFEEMAEKYAEDNGINVEVYYTCLLYTSIYFCKLEVNLPIHLYFLEIVKSHFVNFICNL